MRNNKLKVWSCIVLLLAWSFAGLQGDQRLDPWTPIEAAAQTAPQECKDASGATIPCPPADDEDRGRTDCEDADRDGVCDSQEPSGCVGQLDELGNGCTADDDIPGTARAFCRTCNANGSGIYAAARPSTYPQANCNDPDGATLTKELTGTLILAAPVSPTTGCPDPEPVFDCELSGHFASCNTLQNSEPEGADEGCASSSEGTLCCQHGEGGSICACIGAKVCAALKAFCGLVGGTSPPSGPNTGECHY